MCFINFHEYANAMICIIGIKVKQDRYNNLSNTLQWLYFFPCFSLIFDLFINIHEYANKIIFIKGHDIYKFVI